jgi:hypothetical protein
LAAAGHRQQPVERDLDPQIGTIMTSVENPIPPQDLSGIVGRRFVYTYANGR